MLKPNEKTLARKEAFRKIGETISRTKAQGPTLFNPHYAIRGQVVQDARFSSKTGPKMKTLQWEANGRRK